MSDITFVDKSTVVPTPWFQDVNNAVYRALGSGGVAPATPAQALANIGGISSTEVANRMHHVFEWMTDAQKAGAQTGTGVMDLTAPCQAAIDSGYSLDWGGSDLVYGVTKLTFNKNGKTYRFNGCQILAIDTGAQKCLIDWKAGFCTVYGLAVVGNWKANYTSMIYWHSASAGAPAQSNVFFGLSINNALIGILFGEISPTVPVDAAQSENFVYGLRTRGVQNVIYANQSNGFLKFIGGQLACGKNEWDIVNPGVYSYAASTVATVLLGVISIVGGDLEKTDTQLGSGFVVSGGALAITGINIEIASQVCTLSGGVVHITDIVGGYWGNASVSWAALSGSTGGVLHVGHVTLNKAAAAWAADTAFLDFGGASGWDVTLIDLYLENQRRIVFNNTNTQPDIWTGANTLYLENVRSVATVGAGGSPVYPRASTSVDNLLDLRGTDVIGNDIGTWFKRDIVGVGAIALNADVPASSEFFNSVQVTPQVGGDTTVTNMDLTSLATVKATAIKCKPGDQFSFSGWFRMTTAGTGKVEVLFATVAGAASSALFPADNTTVLTNAWVFISGMFTAPALGAYFGIGCRGTGSTVMRIAGLKVSKLYG